MRRFRFYVPGDDGRPMAFPPEGPFWITGYSDTHTVVVAFSPDLETMTRADRWPDAEDIDDGGEQEIVFSDRFGKPDWWERLVTKSLISSNPPAPQAETAPDVVGLAWTAVQSAGEWDDRTSPDGYEDYLFFKPNELHQILVSFFETVTEDLAALRQPVQVDEAMVERAYKAAEATLRGTSADIGVGELDRIVRAALTAAVGGGE